MLTHLWPTFSSANQPEMVTKMKGAPMRAEEWPQNVELVARAILTRVDPIGFFL